MLDSNSVHLVSSVVSCAPYRVWHQPSAPCLRRKSVQRHLRVLALSVQLRGELLQSLECPLGLFGRLLQQVVVYAPRVLAIRLEERQVRVPINIHVNPTMAILRVPGQTVNAGAQAEHVHFEALLATLDQFLATM